MTEKESHSSKFLELKKLEEELLKILEIKHKDLEDIKKKEAELSKSISNTKNELAIVEKELSKIQDLMKIEEKVEIKHLDKSKEIYKIVLMGEGGCGRTTMLQYMLNSEFNPDTKMTIGIQFFDIKLNVDEKEVELLCFDLAGQKRFRFAQDEFVKGAKGIIFSYDVTRVTTIENVIDWMKIAKKYDYDVPILCIGTKIDQISERSVTEDHVKEMMERYSMFDHVLISSKTGENIKLVFEKLVRKMRRRQMC